MLFLRDKAASLKMARAKPEYRNVAWKSISAELAMYFFKL